MLNINVVVSKKTPKAVRAEGWVSLTYPYKPAETALLVMAVRQLGSKPNLLVNCPGGVEIFVPGKLNRGLI
jgi:hypothetical protein